MKALMKGNGQLMEIKSMELEQQYFEMGLSIKENTLMVSRLVWADLFMPMEICMKDNGSKICKKEKASLKVSIRRNHMMDNGKQM